MIAIVLLGVTVAPAPCAPTDLTDVIYRLSHEDLWARRQLATELAGAIVTESRRFDLDPLLLAAVGLIESNYRTRPTGPGYLAKGYGRKIYERGVFQIAPRSAVALQAWRAMRRCLRRMGPPSGASRCPSARVWRRKSGFRHFVASDLRDPLLGTWVAAFEIAEHLRLCHRRHPRGHGWRDRWHLRQLADRLGLPLAKVWEMHRWSHYNMGPVRPRYAYTRRLASAYVRIRRLACEEG